MSNLGGYQVITTVVKKVGGPAAAGAILAAGHALTFAVGVAAKTVVDKVRK
ncbi:MAG: hypothetical protein LUH00_11925 [Lachnospiraceae bacterium]|nr:hypothetical protein [Lachnospiraceae bacterium]